MVKLTQKYNEIKIKIEKYKPNRAYERKSILPYTKWYVKMYHKKYEYGKIIDAVIKRVYNDISNVYILLFVNTVTFLIANALLKN